MLTSQDILERLGYKLKRDSEVVIGYQMEIPDKDKHDITNTYDFFIYKQTKGIDKFITGKNSMGDIKYVERTSLNNEEIRAVYKFGKENGWWTHC